jgi:hypothetical protein
MDHNSFLLNDNKFFKINSVYEQMPRYLISKHRVHKMFFKTCNEEISSYETCIENPKW